MVLGDKVEIIPANDDSAVHLCRNNTTSQDTTTDRHLARERALLVNISSINGFLRGLVAETNVLVPASLAGHDLLATSDFSILEDVLLLERFFNLFSHVGVCSMKKTGRRRG